MKTERRHQLETNELADSLAHWVEAIKPYVRTIAGVLIAVVVLAFAYAFVSRHAAAKAREGWDEYFEAFSDSNQPQFNRAKFDDVVDKFPGTPAAWWARTAVGDINLNDGSNLLYTNKSEGRVKLHSAVDDYESVLKEATESAVLQRATFGLARAHESLGELKEAGEAYSSLASKWPNSALADSARKRAEDIKRQDTKQFYDWFDKQSPEKSLLNEPGKPGERPKFDLDIRDMPKSKPLIPDDGKTEEPGQSDQPELPETSSDAPPSDVPSTDQPPANDSEPKDESSASEAPKGEAPAEPKASESGKP